MSCAAVQVGGGCKIRRSERVRVTPAKVGLRHPSVARMALSHSKSFAGSEWTTAFVLLDERSV